MWTCSNHMQQYSPLQGFLHHLPYTLLGYSCIIYGSEIKADIFGIFI